MHFGFIPKNQRDVKLFKPAFERKNIKVSLFDRNGFWLKTGAKLKAGFFTRKEDFKEFMDKQYRKYKSGEKKFDQSLFDLNLVFMRTVNSLYSEYPLSRDYTEFLLDVVRITELEGVPTVNPVRAIEAARKKHVSYYLLAKNGIRTPKSFTSHDMVRTYLELSEFETPLVFKPSSGSGGVGVTLVGDKQTAGDVTSLYGRLRGVGVLQEYIPNPGRDIRLIVLGDQTLGGIYRIASEGMSKSGVTVGGKPVQMKPDSELCELAVKSAEILGCRIAGVDVIEGKEGYVVLEVNACPAFDGFMKATGINVPDEIAGFLKKEAKK